MMNTSSPESIEVFYIYAKKDANLRDELAKHLAPLRRQNAMRDWHHQKIPIGTNRKRAARTHLDNAHMILLLISSDFIDSDYCYSIEMQRALERHKQGKARVIPIILRSVDLEGTPIHSLSVLPTNSEAVTSWANQDAAFTDVAIGIREVLREMRAGPVPFPPTISSDDLAEPTPTSQFQFFDETICQTATMADLNMEQVEAFLQKDLVRRQGKYHTDLHKQEQMKALGLLREDHPSYGALLCFGLSPSRQIPDAYTQCIDWQDTKPGSLSGSPSGDKGEYRGSLLQQFVQAHDFLVQHLGDQVSHGDKPTLGKLYARVLDEVLTNALIHRQYMTETDGKQQPEGVTVKIFSDRVEIHSPGKSLLDIAILEKAFEKHLYSHSRNPQIMSIFYLAGHIEKAGTGIARMQYWMQEAGLPLPEIGLDEQTQTFSIVLRRQPDEHESTPWDKKGRKNSARQYPKGNNTRHVQPNSFWFRRPYRFALTFVSIAVILVLVSLLGISAYPPIMRLIDPTSHLTPTPVPASRTIEIASDLPTSGLDTTIGLPVQNGVQMAIDNANNNHFLSGYTLKLTPHDDVGKNSLHDPQAGADNVRKAIADNLVAGIVGPYNSIVAEAELPIANQASLALISPSNTYPCLTKNASVDPDCTGHYDIESQMRPTGQLTYFRLCTTDDREGKAVANYFFNVPQYQKVLLLKDDSDPYSFSLAQAFQQEWTQLQRPVIPLGLPENASDVQDYQNALQAVASVQPDLIYFSGNEPNSSYVLQALSNIPQLKTVPFASAGGIVDSGFLQTAAEIHPSAPVYASLPIQDPAHSGTPVGIDFERNYTANGYNGYNDYRPYTASAYDATMMLIQAIKTVLQEKKVSTPHGAQDQAGARQFRQAVLQELAHETYTGATGTHSFDQNGDTTNHTISFYQLDLSRTQPEWTWHQQVNA